MIKATLLIWETLFKVLVGALFETKPDHFLKIKVLFQRYGHTFLTFVNTFLKIVGDHFSISQTKLFDDNANF